MLDVGSETRKQWPITRIASAFNHIIDQLNMAPLIKKIMS